MEPVLTATVLSQRYTVALEVPDCPHVVPKSETQTGGQQLRVTRIACTWGVLASGEFSQWFDVSGPRILKGGREGDVIKAWWWRETPGWLADIVAPYTTDWYNAATAS